MSDAISSIQFLLSHSDAEHAPVDLVDVVCHALLIVKSDAARRGIHLHSCGLERPQILSGDYAQLQLIALNLLRNSLEATPSGGVVETAVVGDRGGLTLRVADSGAGFMGNPVDPKHFLLASSKPGGLGLGLYMVRLAAQNYEAEIRFGQSQLGGAQVEVFFPAGRSDYPSGWPWAAPWVRLTPRSLHMSPEEMLLKDRLKRNPESEKGKNADHGEHG